MARQKDDVYTSDLYGKNPRGRPRDPNAKSTAQRMREYRQRKKFNMLQQSISVTRYEK